MKIFGYEITRSKPSALPSTVPAAEGKGIDDRPKVSALPSGRSSEPDYDGIEHEYVRNNYALVTPQFLTELIPLIRGLAQGNPDVSQALHNIVSLGNTGHKIFFDRQVKEKLVDEMRNHLVNKRKKWAPGQAGMDGLVNKLFSQLLIGGALSSEAVIEESLEGIRSVMLINPERIVFKLSPDKITYEPYQRLKSTLLPNRSRVDQDLIKLNPNTYQYLALNGDGEAPHGIPPYLPVVKRIETQGHMNQNIDFIVDIMGLIGFLEVKIQKPDEDGTENEDSYRSRLQKLLDDAKKNVLGGLKDGVVAGFVDDHEFNFNSAARNFEGVTELYKNNEMQIASALKQDASLWGRDYGTSEAKANITFIKMLSELRNIQNVVKTHLEWLYTLELKLAGYNFDYLTVSFNRSTLQDDYKFQQAEEIKVKNVLYKYCSGIISIDQAADELGYEAPFAKKPLVPLEMLIGKTSPKEGDAKASKNKSAKKTRSSKKALPKNK